MSSIVTAHEIVAAAVCQGLDGVDLVLPLAPAAPQAGTAYVAADEDWLSEGDGFCGDELRLVVDVCAPVVDIVASQRWLAARAIELRRLPHITVGSAQTWIRSVRRPELYSTTTGDLVVIRGLFHPITIEED